MTREDIIRMAREAGFVSAEFWPENFQGLFGCAERFAALVATAERKAMMQLFTDPENQPTQHGTVTVEYMQREIAAEREAMLDLVDSYAKNNTDLRDAIRARGQA